MATTGQIPSNITLAAGEALRRNAGDTAFEAFTPGSGGSGVMTLLYQASGTDTNASATTVSSIAISGLTAADTLVVEFSGSSATQQTGIVSLHNVTDNVAMVSVTNNAVLAAGAGYSCHAEQRQSPAGATSVIGLAFGSTSSGTGGVRGGASTFTTNWTGSWTLGLRHAGVTAGGTFSYNWSVYKLTGQ